MMTLISHLRGILSLCMLTLNTVVWFVPVMLCGLLKFFIPLAFWRKWCDRLLIYMCNAWIAINNLIIRLTRKIQWDVQGVEQLAMNDWYLVISNHQTWVDIIVLLKVLYKRIPFLKFFLKQELIWVPFLGTAWWALDFPFMKRYSKAHLQKYPHLKGKDLAATRKACARFKRIPTSVMNFVEGTRFRAAKRDAQNSPYTYLLRPRAGGIAFVLNAMEGMLHKIVNVTIYYPDGIEEFWAFLCGKVKRITVVIEVLPIPEELIGDYQDDEAYRMRFQGWLSALWADKDRLLSALRDG